MSVLRAKAGRVFVGYRTFPSHRLITAQNRRKFFRRLRWMKKAFAQGRITAEEVHQRLMSWLGHAGQADSLPLFRQLLKDLLFVDGKFQGFSDASP